MTLFSANESARISIITWVIILILFSLVFTALKREVLVVLSRFHPRNVKEKKIKMLCLGKYHLGIKHDTFDILKPFISVLGTGMKSWSVFPSWKHLIERAWKLQRNRTKHQEETQPGTNFVPGIKHLYGTFYAEIWVSLKFWETSMNSARNLLVA